MTPSFTNCVQEEGSQTGLFLSWKNHPTKPNPIKDHLLIVFFFEYFPWLRVQSLLVFFFNYKNFVFFLRNNWGKNNLTVIFHILGEKHFLHNFDTKDCFYLKKHTHTHTHVRESMSCHFCVFNLWAPVGVIIPKLKSFFVGDWFSEH
jgi:hypothetical protein